MGKMGKRGMMTFVTLVGIIFALLVICVLFFAAVNLGGSAKARNRMLMAKDISLSLDAAFATKQEAKILVNYPNTINDRDVVASDNLVWIYPSGKFDAKNAPVYPYTQNAYYSMLKETIALNIVVFAKDKDEVALHPLLVAGALEDVDTKAEPSSQTLQVISDDDILKGAVNQALRVEGFKTQDADANMVVRIVKSPDGKVVVAYGNADVSISRKEKKLSQIILAAFGTGSVLEDQTLSGNVPDVTISIPAEMGAQDAANRIASAVLRYYS